MGTPVTSAIICLHSGLGTGVIRDHKVIEKWISEKVPMRPDPENVKAYQHFYELYKIGLEASRPLFREMAG
jgi:hypothetical protein